MGDTNRVRSYRRKHNENYFTVSMLGGTIDKVVSLSADNGTSFRSVCVSVRLNKKAQFFNNLVM